MSRLFRNYLSMIEDAATLELKWYQKSVFKYGTFNVIALLSTTLIALFQIDTAVKSYLKKQSTEHLKIEVEQTKNSLNSDLIYLRSTSRFVSNLYAISEYERFSNALQILINSSNNIIAIQLIGSDPNKNQIKISERRFVESNGSSFIPLKTSISLLGERFVERNVGKKKGSLSIEAASSGDGLPITMVAGQFSQNDPSQWVVIHLTESYLSRLFRKNTTFASAFVNTGGKPILGASNNSQSHLLLPMNEFDLIQSSEAKTNTLNIKERDLSGTTLLESSTSLELTDGLLVVQSTKLIENNFIKDLYIKIGITTLLLIAAFASLVHIFVSFMNSRVRIMSRLIAAFSNGDTQLPIPEKIRDELSQLEFQLGSAAARISEENRKLAQSIRKRFEVKVHSEKQLSICPKPLLTERGISTFSYFKPAKECSGDWWGRFTLGKNKELVVLADASGHEGTSSTAVLLTNTYFRTLERCYENQNQLEITPSQIIKELNRNLYGSLNGAVQVKIFVMLLEVEKMIGIVASGGTCHPLLIEERFTGAVNVDGEVLGIKPDIEVDEVPINLHPGQRFVFHTDGLFSCRNIEDEPIDRNEFFEQLGERRREPIGKFAEFFFAKLRGHFGDEHLDEDMTLVILEIQDLQTAEPTSKPSSEPANDFPKINSIEWKI